MDVSNETFGSDPFKGEPKTLQVVFETPNGGFERDFDEGDTIRFGGRYGDERASMEEWKP
jgi:hypothetical protein